MRTMAEAGGAVEQVVHVARAQLHGLFMAIVWVPEGWLMGIELEREMKVDVPDARGVCWTSVAGGWK
jgi:hypothetical protein